MSRKLTSYMIFRNFAEYDKEIILSVLIKIGRINEIMNIPHITSQTKVKIKETKIQIKNETNLCVTWKRNLKTARSLCNVIVWMREWLQCVKEQTNEMVKLLVAVVRIHSHCKGEVVGHMQQNIFMAVSMLISLPCSALHMSSESRNTRLGGMKQELHDFKNEIRNQLSNLSNSLDEKFDSSNKPLGDSEGKIKANINGIVTESLMTMKDSIMEALNAENFKLKSRVDFPEKKKLLK